MMREPITYFYENYGCDAAKIERIISGSTFFLVLLKNGNIGVCATLTNKIECEIEDLFNPDLTNTNHRILLNAYYNALFNYQNEYKKTADIFEEIDFRKYKKNVMIGYFRSLTKKFEAGNIKVCIFDKLDKDANLIGMDCQHEYISKADSLILTATSIFNGTFLDIINNTKSECDIFILGPSSIMHKDMFEYRNVKKIFGSIFRVSDIDVLNMISNGGGTRQILPMLRKVFISKDESALKTVIPAYAGI